MTIGGVSGTHRPGASPDPGGGYRFEVWAPRATAAAVRYPAGRRFALDRAEDGYFLGLDRRARSGDRYWIELGRRRLPDPASRSQPDGVLGASQLVDIAGLRPETAPDRPISLREAVLYELHVGTFTPSGTFEGATERLPELAATGVTAVELMPVSEEAGDRGWGYGPVFPAAARHAYGGPEGLVRFVEAAHGAGLSVVLDVVYNHWGGAAGFLERFGPYFHPRATTPWGPTPNVSGPGGDEVRRYFSEAARVGFEEYRVDGFRLDAVHEVFDRPPRPFWAEFSDGLRAVGRRIGRSAVLIAESDLNDARILRPTDEGGWGLDGQWSDDFHHVLHAALTGETRAYFEDYGRFADLGRSFERPFLFEGQFSRFRDRRHGAPSGDTPADRFIVFDQNHDQVGNRGDGARLTNLLTPGLARVGLALTLLAPYVPMMFMGEEYGETRPFYFFADPQRGGRGRTTTGRLRQLRHDGYRETPPDPFGRTAFARSHLDWTRATTPEGRRRRALVTELLRLRRQVSALGGGGASTATVDERTRTVEVRRTAGGSTAVLRANLGSTAVEFRPIDDPARWTVVLRTDEPKYGGTVEPTVSLGSALPPETLEVSVKV